MSTNLSFFYSNLGGTVNFISLLFAVLGLVLSVYFYFKSRKNRIPVYRSRTTRIIRSAVNRIDSLEVLYDKKRLNALTITKVAFWNAGKETISNTDISGNDKLRLEIKEDFEFLSCDIVTQTKKANNFRCCIEADKKTILLEFDYLDFDEGVVLKIRHTGSSNEDVYVSGSIKGVPLIQRKDGVNLVKKKHIIVNYRMLCVFRWLVGIASIALTTLGVALLFISNNIWIQINESLAKDRWFQYLSSFLFLTIGVSYMFALICTIKRKVPKSLSAVYNDEDF